MQNEKAVNVQRITTWEELSALQASWNALAGPRPMRSWDWLATWWKHYGATRAERELCVLAVYENAAGGGNGRPTRLIGLAPWYIDRTIVHGRTLRWLGDGEVCTDHPSLLSRPEAYEQVATAIAEELSSACDDWDMIDLVVVDADDVAVAALVAALEDRDCLVARRSADACWVLDLPPTWDDYLAAVSKSHRKQLRQLERRVLESDRARWHQVLTREELETAWPILVDLHQRRRQSLGEPGCFASLQFHDFHREVAVRLLDRGQLRLSWLELDGQPAAAEYHFADATTTYAYQGGVDPERLDLEPGRLSSILCLRRAIEERHAQFDFLRGDEPYKAHWRATPRAACSYRVLANRRLARLRGRALELGGAAAGWVSGVRCRVSGLRENR